MKKKGEHWGKGEFANMPKEKEMYAYPKGHNGKDRSLDDTITGIDSWSAQMERKRDSHLSDQH